MTAYTKRETLYPGAVIESVFEPDISAMAAVLALVLGTPSNPTPPTSTTRRARAHAGRRASQRGGRGDGRAA